MKNYELKASYKMRMAISRLEKKFGKLQKTYGVEVHPSNRVGKGFYDYCELRSDIFRGLGYLVNHDGETFNQRHI